MERVACGPFIAMVPRTRGDDGGFKQADSGKSYNSGLSFSYGPACGSAILLGVVVPALILLLIWDLTDNPTPFRALSLLPTGHAVFFSYVFVAP